MYIRMECGSRIGKTRIVSVYRNVSLSFIFVIYKVIEGIFLEEKNITNRFLC